MDSELGEPNLTDNALEQSQFLKHAKTENLHYEDKNPISFVSSDPGPRIVDFKQSSGHNGKHFSKESRASAWRRFQGFLLTMIHVVAFSSAGLIAKLLFHYHPLTLTVFRFQGIFIPSLLMIIISDYRERRKPEDDRNQVLNSVWPPNQNGNWKRLSYLCGQAFTGCCSVTLLMYSLGYIQLGDTLVIQGAAPIFTNLLAYFLLGEPTGVFPVCLALMSILGVGIISRPPLLTGEEEFNADVLIGCLFSVGAMLLAVVCIVSMRYLKDVHVALITFSTGALGTFQNLTLAVLFGVFQLPSDLKDISLTLSLAVLIFTSQTFLTIALKREEASPVVLYRTMQCVVGFVLQKIFLDIPADIYSVLGACLVIFGVLGTIVRNELNSLPRDHMMRQKLWFMLK